MGDAAGLGPAGVLRHHRAARSSTIFTSAAKSGGFERDGGRLNRLELKLDQKGWEEIGKLLDDVSARIEKAAAKAKDRKADEQIAGTVALMLFEARAPAAPRRASGNETNLNPFRRILAG